MTATDLARQTSAIRRADGKWWPGRCAVYGAEVARIGGGRGADGDAA
jgi:hypothetical protein